MTAGQELPFRGSGRGYFVASSTEDPAVEAIRELSTGRSLVLGRYSLVAHELMDRETLAIRNGSYTLTLASGDMIQGVYAGQAAVGNEASVVAYEVSGAITGGTGRFAVASGVLVFRGLADLATGDRSREVTGTISTQG